MKDTVMLLVLLLIAANITLAQDTTKAEEVESQWDNVICIALKVLQFAAVGIAVLVVVMAGVRAIISDEPGSMTESRNMIVRALTGIFIVLVAVHIVNNIVTGSDIGTVDMSSCSDVRFATTTSQGTIVVTTTAGGSTTVEATTTTFTIHTYVETSTTTTSTVDSCMDPANKYAIPNKNSCMRASLIGLCKMDLDANGVLDIDQTCGSGFHNCCCDQGYMNCCE